MKLRAVRRGPFGPAGQASADTGVKGDPIIAIGDLLAPPGTVG